MIVNINNSTYEMNSKQYKAVLDTASKAVTCGICNRHIIRINRGSERC